MIRYNSSFDSSKVSSAAVSFFFKKPFQRIEQAFPVLPYPFRYLNRFGLFALGQYDLKIHDQLAELVR